MQQATWLECSDIYDSICSQLRMSHVGELGSGAGKGGGGGGSIREAGGSFGKMEAAREEEFFYKQVGRCEFELSCIYTYCYNFLAKGAAKKSED